MIRIDRRFRGPPASGNGGYVAGVLAETLGGSDCEVTLRSPPPLDRQLEVRAEGARRSLWDGERLIAEAGPSPVELTVPPAPGDEEASAASARFTGFSSHVFPGCFVCGPERAAGDGLRIFPGRVGERLVAAPWVPEADLLAGDGRLGIRFIWAALDCPGYFAVEEQAGAAVLGRLAVHVGRRPRRDAPLTLLGWPIASDGRKHQAGTALYEGGELAAFARATWISI